MVHSAVAKRLRSELASGIPPSPDGYPLRTGRSYGRTFALKCVAWSCFRERVPP